MVRIADSSSCHNSHSVVGFCIRDLGIFGLVLCLYDGILPYNGLDSGKDESSCFKKVRYCSYDFRWLDGSSDNRDFYFQSIECLKKIY